MEKMEKTFEKLINKLQEEFDNFRAWLLTQSPEEILDHAYKYMAKNP